MHTQNKQFQRNVHKKFTCSFVRKIFIPLPIWTNGIEMDTHFRLVLKKFFIIFIALHLFGIESRFDTLFQINFLKLFLSLHYLQVRLALVHPKRTDLLKISLKKYFPLHLFELGESFCAPPFFRKNIKIKRPPTRDTFSVPQVGGLMNLWISYSEKN